MNSLTTQEIQSLAAMMSNRRDLAVDSVELLLNALKVNDVEGTKIALRSLGVNSHDDIAIQVGALMSSLHTLVEDFKTSVEESKDGGLPGAVRRLKEVVRMNFEAADKTLERCETQGYLYRDHKLHINELEQAFNDAGVRMPEYVKAKFALLRQDVDIMQKENHEVIMAQSFQDISSQTVNKVITLMQNIEQQMVALTVACTDDTEIQNSVQKISTSDEYKTSQQEADCLFAEESKQ
jgi:chemotaxis protein CheZ